MANWVLMATNANPLDELPAGDVGILERSRTQHPRRYIVWMHNDDYTTQEFVVHVLMRFFHHGHPEATALMLEIHTKGKAKVGVYTKDVAETKVMAVTTYARQNQMPLLLTMEKAP